MSKYNYQTLNDKEFEDFVCDLLNSYFNLEFRSFKKGRDKGIDLRISTAGNPNAVVAQVKQYATNFKVLFNNLKTEELPKVQVLKPDEYWVITSLPLSATEKDKIYKAFHPFIKNVSDIIGRDDLDYMLRKKPQIEKHWLKLWLTNTRTLSYVLNNAVQGRSRFIESKIISTIKLYVKTKSFDDAFKIIRENHFLLISGQPGIGKTTLADMLTFFFLREGFELVFVDKSVKEAEEVFERSQDEKQIFYFDDFLGSNHVEILNPKSTESSIVDFIKRVQESKNKYLVLTTRTTILNEARQKYYKLKSAGLDLSKMELQLEDYNTEQKGRILYNHLHHGKIDRNYKLAITDNRNYWKIIKHRNYTPRIVEFFNETFNLLAITPDKYFEFVMNCLEHPNEIWLHSYTTQLQPEDRYLVATLYSFGQMFWHYEYDWDSGIDKECLFTAYNARLDHEIEKNGHARTNDSFNNALSRLLDGYLTSTIDAENVNPVFGFINPSIRDFLDNYYKKSEEESWNIIHGSCFIEQLKVAFDRLINVEEKGNLVSRRKEIASFIDFVIKKQDDLSATIHLHRHGSSLYANAHSCEMAALYSKIGVDLELYNKVDKPIVELLARIQLSKLTSRETYLLMDIISEPFNDSELEKYINKEWDNLIAGLWMTLSTEEDFDRMLEIFQLHRQNMAGFLEYHEESEMLLSPLVMLAGDITDNLIMNERFEISTVEELDELKYKVREARAELFEKYGLKDPGYDENFYFADFDEDHFSERKRTVKKFKMIQQPEKTNEITDEKIMEKNINELFSDPEF